MRLADTIVVAASVLAGCGGDGPSSPIAPGPATFTLSGIVRTAWNEPMGDVGVAALVGDKAEGNMNTDAGGRFSIAGLPARDYMVRATKWGYEAPLMPIHLTGNAVVEITMDRGRVIVQGSVSEAPPSIAAIEGGRVEVVDGPDAGRFVMSVQQGEFRMTDLRWGTFTMRASRAGYASAEIRFDIPAPGGPGAVFTAYFRLAPSPGS